MKPTMIAMLAAALLAGNLNAQTSAEIDAMILRLLEARDKPASPAAVSALIHEAKPMSTAPWAYGQITPEQSRNNMLIHSLASLMGRKVSFATAREYCVEKQAWEFAVVYGRRAPNPTVAIGYAENWVAADSASLSAKLELLLVRAYEGKQDIREELDALLADNLGTLTSVQASRAILAWNRAAHLDSPMVVLEDAKDFLGRLLAATAPNPDNLRNARAHALAYRASLNEDVNAEIMELLGTVKGTLKQEHAEILYGAFKPVAASNAQLAAFYDALLHAVEAKPASAAFLRKILDQKLKLQ